MQTINDMMRELNGRATRFDLKLQCGPHGTIMSDTAVIAEAPGEREVNMKIPLCGGSGQLLWDALRKHGIQRNQMYVTNVIKRQVSLSERSTAKDAVPKGELQYWEQLLEWELSQLPNLKYILILGKYALQAVLRLKGINKWRGSIIPGTIAGKDILAVVANNPANAKHDPREEVVFRFHVDKLHRARKGLYQRYDITTNIQPTYPQAIDWIRYLGSEVAKGKPLAYDIETISGETACIGFATDAHEGFCINFRDSDSNRFSISQDMELYRRIAKLLNNPKAQPVAQNGSFDQAWLWYKDRIAVGRNWFDTLLAHHTLYPTLPHNLGFLTTQYTDHPYYKDEKDSWREGGDIASFWQYNVKDACITLKVQERELDELQRQSMDRFFFDHVMRLQPHLVRMTLGGIRVDTDLKHRIAHEMSETVQKLLEVFQQTAREAVEEDDSYIPNPNSDKDRKELYFRKMKILGGRGLSVDAENRDRMLAYPGNSAAQKAVVLAHNAWATESKFYSTYVDIRIDEDERIRSEYKQYGTQSAPGRLSSSQTSWGTGANLQNQPERAHPMFCADDGFGFGYFDLAQAEARVVGWRARIQNWMEQFEKARIDGQYDCHRALASDMFDIPYEEVPTYDRDASGAVSLRFVAKRCRHGLNYRMAADRLATTTGLQLSSAIDAYNRYHRSTPELKDWWAGEIDNVRKSKAIFNALGRRFLFMQRLDDESAFDSLIAFYPQSTIGDKVCRVIFLSESDPKWPTRARIALNIHDALIALAPLAKVRTCLQIMKRYAEEPIMVGSYKDNNDKIPLIIPADCKESVPDEFGRHRWSNLKKVEIEV